MQRIEEYNQLLEDSKEVLRKDTTLWKGFLKFATQFTHYQFFDQILIYVQNPKATACATFDQWKKIGRYVRKGEHSIVLLDETGKRGKLRHIFDVTATGPDQEFEYRPKPILPEQREELARKLNAAYSRENSAYAADSARWDGDLEHTLSQIALSMTQEYYNLSPDQAAAQSESTEIPAYYIATATSAMYLLLEKYGFSQEAESLDFSCMNQLDMETFSGVGNAASAILSWTARLVRTVQREQVRERGNEHERNDNGRYSETDHISSGGRFPGSEHRTPGERRESAGVTEVRDDAEKLSEGEQPSGIRESGSEWNTVSGDGEGGRSSGSDQGTGITATAQGRGSDRGTETERSAQMGGTDGILPPSGGGNYSDGTGVQLTLSDYFEIRPTDRENVSDSDTPKAEHEEIQIEQTEQAAGETPAAFVIPESELVRILQRGSGFEGGKIRIAAFYQKESDAAKRAAFLKEEYGIGGWTFQFEEGVTGWVDWNARGLSIKKFHDEDNSVVKLSWLQVEKRIGQLIENDQYFLESEKVEVEPVAEETADEDAEINDEIELDENLDEEEMQESLIEHQSEKEPVSESDTKQNGAVEQEPILSGQNADEKPIAFSEPEKPILDSISGINFRISDEHLGEGSPKQKFRANMDAIHMLKKLETEERNATWQEQEILSKYVGWGGIPEAFDEKRAQWANEYQELKETLTEEEYIAARASTLNAHFTSPAIIRGIYAALERMGFQGGNILEPAMGVGNFFGMLPTTLLGSRLYGIELDSISGRIAQKLYPMANITVAGFETTNQRDFYDVAVGNVPFGNYKVNDRAYNRLGFSIHNYFFAKSLDQIRPGGIIAYVTSHYTMDSKNPSARRYLAQRAKLLGAIRLPDHAFRANAGAEVVADILFLQKREHIVETEDDWIYLGQTDKGYAINTYFLDHPEMILGTLEEQSTQFGKEYTVKADQNQDLSKLLLSAVTKIQGHYEPYEPTAQPEPRSVSVSDRRQQAVDPTIDNMLKITSDGRKIGLDQRLMNPLLSDDTASKVNLCVGNVLRIWEEGKEKRLTQLIFCDNSVPKPNTFNIYDDVKGKLIAAGIPEMEIAYIHDADTEIKKKNLFSKVNDGQVRILLGSTQKMGAGTNVQERLIAIHHLDVGWRPADMIQRNGRIIRQGNRNPVVQVYNYVTEGTFDSYLWQTLENKQKFISQIMTSKSPVRSCEDVDEQVLTYAEVKALCAGDDRIKEKMDLEVDIARLRMLKAEHQSMQYRLEDQLLKTFPEQIREKEGIIQKLDADIKTTEQYPPFAENTIFLEILGKVYTDQKEAAKAFLEAGKTCKDTRSIRIGSYRGFELEGYVNVITAEIQIAVKGKLSHPFELSDVPALNLKRLDSALNKLPERMILERGKLEALYQQREDAQKQLNTPFPQEDELREKTKRLEELAVELDVDAGREPQENEDNEKTTMKISKPTGIRQSRFSRFRRQKDEKEEDADEDIDF